MNLVKEINEIIVDLNNQNYGIASSRLFDFLDVMSEVEKELQSKACRDYRGDPATTYRADYAKIQGEEGWIHDVE